jgi:glucosamine-6-phosphate isomerase
MLNVFKRNIFCSYFCCMEIIVEPSYKALGERTAADLLHIVTQAEKPVICPTSGSTPAALYKALVQQVREQNIDYSNWYFVGLDEWGGMNAQDKGSCRDFVNTELFEPLGIKEGNIAFFDGRAADLERECKRVEDFISQHGGITVAVVGLGMNGHIGMNEPGTPVSTRSHVARIAEETQRIGQKYFDTPRTLSNGLTLGLATLLDAQYLFLMVNGEKKAPIVKRIVEERPNEELPATMLRQHSDFRLYLDADAARLL